MLSQAVLASYERPESDGIHKGQLTVTGISPCPYATYINYHQLDTQTPKPIEVLRMKNGHWQEEEVLEDLRHAGFKLRFTGSNQLTVHIGRVPIAGRPDGLVIVDSREDVLSIKAMSIDRYTFFKQKGLPAFPGIMCQEQLYLASEEFKDKMAGTWIYIKHKDSCRPYDIFVEKDLSYSKPIVEATEEIVLGNAEVKRPDTCPIPGSCRHRLFCWKEELFDTSGIKVADLPQTVQQWKEGKFHQDYGKELVEEARVVFSEYLGDNDLLLVEDLQIRKILSRRSEMDVSKFVELFGANRLPEVMVTNIIKQMRITEV